MNMLENETPKYRKKKNSSTSKSSEKAKHKHEYTEKCIVKYPTPYLQTKKFSLEIATYCKHCGKIGDICIPIAESDFGKRLMTNEEILRNYRDLEIVEISDFFQKYVPISKGDD